MRRLLTLIAVVGCVADARAALDLNSASLAQLEALGGVGTTLAARMVEARSNQPFTDWADAQRRVKGLGPKVAAQLSEQGLTINGAKYTPVPR
jgi:competence protein ComEA